MVRHDNLSGIASGLELANVALQQEARDAFLSMFVAKDPYPPQLEWCNSNKHIKVIFGANQCLRGDSQVHLWDGTKTAIQHIIPGDIVKAFAFESKSFVPSRVNAVFENDNHMVHRFKHASGYLECTKSHKICVVYPSGRHAMIRVLRACKNQLPAVVMNANGAPSYSRLSYEGPILVEPTFDINIDHEDHAFVCDGIVVSNSGKSHAAAYNIAWDATGLYPDWYTGPKTARGINCWVMGDTAENTRDAPQKKLFGPDPKKPGWTDQPGKEALINQKYIIGTPSMKSVSGAMDTVRIKHIPSDTTSVITFKTHGMDIQSLASWSGDRVWIDEEAPKEILDEIIARMTTTNGYVYITECPQHGITPIVKFIQDNSEPGGDVFLTYITDEDAKHIAPEVRERNRRLWASDPAMFAARTQGRATSNSGLIFPFPNQDIIYDPNDFRISTRWKYLGGLDVGWRHPTAACACAWDPQSDVIFVYATYEKAETEYFYHHAHLQSWGPNMTFMIDPASGQVNQGDGTKILEKYWKLAHGENYLDIDENKRKYIKADNSFHTGMDSMWHRFNTRRLLIRKDLRDLIGQYASYEWNKDGDGPRKETPTVRYDIITAMRYMVMGVQDYAHRLDDIPPWLEMGDWDEPVVEPSWRPYRAGRDQDAE